MPSAQVIDFQAYRSSRVEASKTLDAGGGSRQAFSMMPVMMWVPYWGFIPMMVAGVVNDGA